MFTTSSHLFTPLTPYHDTIIIIILSDQAGKLEYLYNIFMTKQYT